MALKHEHRTQTTRTQHNISEWVVCVVIGIIFAACSCKSDGYPKPLAYPRISYPQSEYKLFHLEDAGVVFEMPAYIQIEKKTPATKDKHALIRWYNLRMDSISATIHLTILKESASSIQQRMTEKERIIFEEAQQESNVKKQVFTSTDQTIRAYIYKIEGTTATPFHWMILHSQNQLATGTILFDKPIHAASMGSIVNGISADIKHQIETFRFSK